MPHSFGRIPSPRFDHGAHQTRVIMAVAESEEGVLIQVGTVKPSSAACGWPCAACGWRSSRFYKVCCVVLKYSVVKSSFCSEEESPDASHSLPVSISHPDDDSKSLGGDSSSPSTSTESASSSRSLGFFFVLMEQ